MKEILFQKLHLYLRENNPDILLPLEEERKVTSWMRDKILTVESLIKELDGQPEYTIEQTCMEFLTKDLRPSKFIYIKNILEEEFENNYKQLLESGSIMFEGVNLVRQCKPVFDELHFNKENEDDRLIKYAIIGAIAEYLDK